MTIQIPEFPRLDEARMRQLLSLPRGKRRVVFDTDTKNEIDDQFALAWALMRQDMLEIEGVYAAPFSFQHHREPLLKAHEAMLRGQQEAGQHVVYAGDYDQWAHNLQRVGANPYELPFPDPAEGMELSYQEILKIYELMAEDPDGLVYRGSPGYLRERQTAIRSEAVDHLIERAMANDERPLYVIAIGAATNIACALLQEPRILDRIVVVWTSAYPSYSKQCNRASLNLMQDLPASCLIFDSGVPHVYLPGFCIGEQLKISLPEMEAWVAGKGRIGDYLHELFTNNPIHHQRGIDDLFGRTWIMWDLINVAWLIDPEWVPSELVRSPILDQEMYWQHDESRHLMREAVGINRDAIYRDFLSKLAARAEQ